MINDFITLAFRLFFISYCGLLIIHQLIKENSKFNLSKATFLIYTGKISYGIYCFHGVIISVGIVLLPTLPFVISSFLWAIILLGFTFLVASISYVFIEKPFLKLKSRIG